MSKKLLKASAIINILTILLPIIMLAQIEPILALIGTVLLIIPGIALIVNSVIFFSYSKMSQEELKKHKTSILVWGIVLIFLSFISGILTLIAYDKLDEKFEDQEEETIDKETKKLDMLLKLGVGLIALSGIMFATSSWNILSGIVKVIGLVLFSVLFFILAKFAKEKLQIKKSEVTYYILGNLFLVFSLIAAGFFNLFGTWLSFTGNGCNLLMAIIFVVLTILFIISFKKYSQLSILNLVYISSILAITYGVLQIGVELKFILLAWSIVALALSLNRNEINIYTKVLNDFGKILIIGLLFALFMIVKLESFIWVNIVSGVVLMVAAYLQAILKNNYLYKIVSPLITILFGCYCVYILNLDKELGLIISTLLTTVTYFLAYLKRDDENLFLSSFWITSISFLYYYVIARGENLFIVTLFIASILILLNLISRLKKKNEAMIYEQYSQPLKVLLFIDAIALTISNYVSNIEGNILLLSIGFVFILSYFIQSNKIIKNIYYIGSLAAIGFYYLDILFMKGLPSSFIAGIVNILTVTLLTGVAFKSDDYKFKLKEVVFLGASLITYYNVISITLNYNILLLGVIISFILFVMLAVVFLNNRYLFGISAIMSLIGLSLLFEHVVDLTVDWRNILQSLVLFAVIFVFIHAILGNASKKVKDILEIVAISGVFLAIIFDASLLIGIYIGVLCIVFILKGMNSKFIAYYYTGIVFLILNILVQFKNYWESIPAWAYILLGGLVLVGVVTYKEYKNIKPEIKEVKEEKNEELKEENTIKTLSSEIILLSIVLLMFAFSNIDMIFNKVEDFYCISDDISYLENY